MRKTGGIIRSRRRGGGWVLRQLGYLLPDSRGITGVETAIILIAFVVLCSLLAYTVLSAGIFATDKSQAAIYQGLENTLGTVKIVGDIIGKDIDDDGSIDQITFTMNNSIGGTKVDLTETTDTDGDGLLSDESERYHFMVLEYVDEDVHLSDITWTKTQLGAGNGDDMLDPDEKMLITVDLSATDNAVTARKGFNVIIISPSGADIVIERAVPAVVEPVTKLIYGGGLGASGMASGGGSTPVASGMYRKKITIDSNRVAANLTDFPVLINLIADSDLVSRAQSDGDDILFTAADGETVLSYETEKYNSTTGELVAWVKIPSLSGGTDTEIYMYYGDASAESGANAADVWSNGYEAVYHLHQDFTDATGNHDATNGGSVDLTGLVANGQDFTPASEIQAGNWSVGGTAITLQAWLNPDDFDQDDPRAISKANGGNTNNHVFMLGLGGSGDRYVRGRLKTGTSDSSGTTTLEATVDPADTGTWQLIALTYNGSSMVLLKNGTVVRSTGKTGNLRENSWDIAIGNNPGNADTGWASLDGKLDEIRVSSLARSSEWLTTEYNNQMYPDKAVHGSSGFFTLGVEEEAP